MKLLLKPVHCQLLVLRRDLLRGGSRLTAAVTNLEIPQESLIFYFACNSLESTETLYLKVVGIHHLQREPKLRRSISADTIKNDVAYKEKWEVDSDGEVGTFFNSIADLFQTQMGQFI